MRSIQFGKFQNLSGTSDQNTDFDFCLFLWAKADEDTPQDDVLK